MLAAEWKALSEDARKPYVDTHSASKVAHMKVLVAWQTAHPEEGASAKKKAKAKAKQATKGVEVKETKSAKQPLAEKKQSKNIMSKAAAGGRPVIKKASSSGSGLGALSAPTPGPKKSQRRRKAPVIDSDSDDGSCSDCDHSSPAGLSSGRQQRRRISPRILRRAGQGRSSDDDASDTDDGEWA